MDLVQLSLGRIFLAHQASRSPLGLVVVLIVIAVLVVLSRRQR